MSQEIEVVESTTLKVMTIDQAQREYYRATLEKLTAEQPTIIAGIKNKEGAERAAAWRVEVREFIKAVQSGRLGAAQAELNKYKREVDAEIRSYVGPAEDLFDRVKDRMDRWYADELARVNMLQAKATAKAIEKAETKQQQQIQTFMDLGKPKAAETVARRPLAYTPPTIQMPKIKHAIWKKKYVVQIDDMGELLAYIAKHPEHHGMVDMAALTAKLEGIAVSLDGNMKQFKGVRCFVTANSAAIGGTK